MSGRITRLLLLALLFHFQPGSVGAEQGAPPPSLNPGDAVVTGFSGVSVPDPAKPRPTNKSAIDLTFIDPDGPSARIVSIGQPGYVWDGRLFRAPKTFDVSAKNVGQVFGVALDDQIAPNIFLAATSAFGLNLVDRGRDGEPERRKVGGPGAGWMKGQFGLDLQGDPGSIYKVDGTTGVVSLFARVTLGGVPNPGPALGNLAYDAAHKQLFVSDLYTGMIHRFNVVDGSEAGPPYDHGVIGRSTANLAPMPFDPANRPNIANSRFNSEDPGTWGFAPPERRVWALALQADRLFYSTRNGAATLGPQIWSVGILREGGFAADARWELDVPPSPGPYSVSDIAFSQKGAMILAQRAPIFASYDYSAFTRPGDPRVLRYWLKDPNDPPSPARWRPSAEEYAVGLSGNYRNTNGGVALGYGYGQDGTLSDAACESSLWTTGQNLRNNPALRSQLEPGGALLVSGLQGSSADAVRPSNEPPAASYFIDYDDKLDDARDSGHMGGVRILTRPCLATIAASGAPVVAGNPPYVSGPQSGGGGGGGGGGDGCVAPNCPPPPVTPVDLAIKKTGETSPAPQVNAYSFTLTITNTGAAFNAASGVITVSDVAPVGMTFTTITASSGWTCTPATVPPSTSLTCSFAGGPVPAGVVGTIMIAGTASGSPPFPPFTNCATVALDPASGLQDTDPSNNKDCVTLTKPVPPVDVAIVKTGAGTLGPVGTTFTYTLAVTNVGAAFTGNGAIVVSDPAPAGVTYASYTANPNSDWSCALSASALNCTYIGTGPASSGALLGTITVTGAVKGDGPFANCATVAVDAGAGVDTDPTNNKSCITLTKDGFTPVDPPPAIKPSCGMNVLFVVDESRSIADANATYNITSALTAAASVLNTNGSQAALVRFSDNALVIQPWSTATYSSLNTGYNPAAGGGTNWEAAMVAAKGLLPHPNSIVIFITDGVPTAFLDNSGAVQYTANSILATNEAIPVVNQIYALGVPIIGIGIGSFSTHLNALLGGNVHATTYGGLGGEVLANVRELCPNLYLTKEISPNYINYYYTPAPQQVTVTLTLTNTTTAPVNVSVQDALPPELTSPTAFTPSPGTASGNPVNWMIPGLAVGATATLIFKATVVPSSPPPTDGSWKCYKNYSQVTTVNGIGEDPTHLMANPVTGPVHEQDEASDQVCVQSHVNSGGGDCGDSYLWVTKKTAFPEICAPGGAPACTFNITVQALCKAFNGPVLFGDGVFSGSSTVAPAITSITNNASPAICAWSGGWSSTTAPSYCAANISLPLNQTITFTVTLGPPLPTLPAGGKYTNCFVADGKTPVPANFPAAYADVNPNTSPNGGLWGNCTPFNVVSSQGLVVCPTGSTLRGAECVRTPPACAPPMVPGAVPGQCVCPQGTVLRGKDCVGQTSCQPPMVPGAVPGQCVCPQGTVLRGRECVRQTTCQPPMVPGAVPGQCVCPQGTVQHGGACVKQIVCRPPMVQNASGTVCVCPAGSVRRGGQCVQPLACRAPMIPNSATTACVCPAGTVQKGRQCVVPTVCDPPARLNRRGACECPRDMVAIGRTCAPRERRPQPSFTPGEFPRGAPAGPRPGGRRPMDQPERR